MMLQTIAKTRVLGLALAVSLLVGVSAFADERPDWRTSSAELRTGDRAGDTIEGIVESITRDGDDIFLRSGRRTVRIEAHGGVKAWYGGRAYRIRDLERGDLIRVDLEHRRGERFRAESVHVLRSVSHDGRDRYDRRNDRRHRDHDRLMSLEGRVVQLDRAYEEMVVRIDRNRQVFVDARLVDRGRRQSSLRTLRVGDVIRLDGWFDGNVFVARSLDELHGRERGHIR